MPRNLFLIFNHRITALQKEDACSSLGVGQIKELPSKLSELWQLIPPELREIDPYLQPIKAWLEAKAEKSDYVLIQGDFGACYIMVNFAFERNLIPIYSTTYREAVEEYGNDGSVKLVHQFQHRIFRKYGR